MLRKCQQRLRDRRAEWREPWAEAAGACLSETPPPTPSPPPRRRTAARCAARPACSGPAEHTEVAHRELQEVIALVLIVIEREGEIQRGTVLCNEVLTLDGAPRNGAKNPSVLLERHLQMPLLHPPRAIDHLYPIRLKQGPRIADAERRQERHLRRKA